MRGRKPTPISIRRLQGDRPIPDGVGTPEAALPRCPAWLAPLAKGVWRRMAPELLRLGMLSVIDRELLEAYCAAYARMRRAEGELGKATDPKTMTTLARMARQEAVVLRQLAAEMGLSQTTRSRVTVTPEDEHDAFEEYLHAGR